MGCFAVTTAAVFCGLPVSGRRDGVITAAPPGMTAENPTNSIPGAEEGAVVFDGLEKIVRTGGLIAATHAGTGDDFEHRIEDPLVKTDQDSDQEAEES